MSVADSPDNLGRYVKQRGNHGGSGYLALRLSALLTCRTRSVIDAVFDNDATNSSPKSPAPSPSPSPGSKPANRNRHDVYHDDSMPQAPERNDDERQPVIAVNDQGLTLGLNSSGALIIWNRSITAWAAQDRLLWLLPLLSRPPDAVVDTVTATGADQLLLPALLRFALESESGYWAGLALGWLEAGFPVTDLINTIATLKDSPTQPQPIRHRALRLWREATAA